MADHRSLPDLSSIPFHHQTPIRFKHPGYDEPNTLLALPRVDGGFSGVHHATALLACQIIANNAFDGSLYLDRLGREPVTTPRNDLLCADVYYFHVPEPPPSADPSHMPGQPVEPLPMPGPSLRPHHTTSAPSPFRYAVVPRFSDWQFPHATFSQVAWPPMSTRNDAGARAPVCALTGAKWALDMSHLVPRNESPWFGLNEMAPLANGSDVNAPGNIMPLRMDIHSEMDKRTFVLVPMSKTKPRKPPGPVGPLSLPDAPAASSTSQQEASVEPSPEIEYVVYVLGGWVPSTSQFAAVFHGCPVRQSAELSPHCLFARFAWAILQQVKGFLLSCPRGKTRLIARLDEQEQHVLREEDKKTLEAAYGGGGSRSASQKKRTREPRASSLGNELVDQEETGNEWYQKQVEMQEEENRGRPRKRGRYDEEQQWLTTPTSPEEDGSQ